MHDHEVALGEHVIRGLLREQRPEWAELPLAPAGAGTDNSLYRLGDDLLLRLPRTPGTAGAVAKEQRWLPRLAPDLPVAVPEPVHEGRPGPGYPLAWSVYRWIEGDEIREDTVEDWAALGRDLAGFVAALQSVDLMGARRAGDLSSYRGGAPADIDGFVRGSLAGCRLLVEHEGLALDVDRLEALWRDAVGLPAPASEHVWLHSDLKPTNLLVRDGRLAAVIDFGGLSIGHPDAEHAPQWDLPAPARDAYRERLGLEDLTWRRARAWALAVGVSGVPYYWDTYPAFVDECLRRLHNVLADAAA
ncbi:aminoglycoside phosphotransferase family protein [Terrabacter sp. MAHUQ-38]|nr:aminoglycoside phosphotransferase family protein [Terrabacter sp. MAHUQ-38]MBC9822782.1 aminoglycoside phosphotransferase family protein [Terrabacter sp. MAHUQ-38]